MSFTFYYITWGICQSNIPQNPPAGVLKGERRVGTRLQLPAPHPSQGLFWVRAMRGSLGQQKAPSFALSWQIPIVTHSSGSTPPKGVQKRYRHPLFSGGGDIPRFSFTQEKAEVILLAGRKHQGNWERFHAKRLFGNEWPLWNTVSGWSEVPHRACARGDGEASAARHLSWNTQLEPRSVASNLNCCNTERKWKAKESPPAPPQTVLQLPRVAVRLRVSKLTADPHTSFAVLLTRERNSYQEASFFIPCPYVLYCLEPISPAFLLIHRSSQTFSLCSQE